MWTSEEREGYRELASYLCHNDDTCLGLYWIKEVGWEGRYIHTQVQVMLNPNRHRLAKYRPESKKITFVFAFGKYDIEQIKVLYRGELPNLIPTENPELLSAGHFKKLLRLYLFICGRI